MKGILGNYQKIFRSTIYNLLNPRLTDQTAGKIIGFKCDVEHQNEILEAFAFVRFHLNSILNLLILKPQIPNNTDKERI